MRRALARAKTDLPPPQAIHALADGAGRLAVRVTPGARGGAAAIVEGKLHLKVRARPIDGEANEAVLKLLAKCLCLPTSRLRMLRGATGRDKQFQISE